MYARDQAWNSVQNIFKDDTPASRWSVSQLLSTKCKSKTIISVIREDSIVASYPYKRPLVLVFADDREPGGCVKAGGGMQEESIFRRTSIHRCLLKDLYPIKDDECLYCPNLPVVFDSEQNGYATMFDTCASFVACAAVKSPHLLAGHSRMRQEDVERVAMKTRMLLGLAHVQDHDCLVLGAWGCGAYSCPPKHVAEIMIDTVLNYSRIERVVFACPGALYDIFEDEVARTRR